METTLGVLVLLVLLAIAVAGLVISSRNARANDASRRARPGVQTVHPAEQQTRAGAAMSHPTYPTDRLG